MTQSFRARVDVRLQANVNDPQGNAVYQGLRSLGHGGVRDVRIGKIVEMELDAGDAHSALEQVERMCLELLVNPTIESFSVIIDENTV
jgi:phosphoribosylformylglycinamidine synthase subunit PurS